MRRYATGRLSASERVLELRAGMEPAGRAGVVRREQRRAALVSTHPTGRRPCGGALPSVGHAELHLTAATCRSRHRRSPIPEADMIRVGEGRVAWKRHLSITRREPSDVARGIERTTRDPRLARRTNRRARGTARVCSRRAHASTYRRAGHGSRDRLASARRDAAIHVR